MRSIVMNMRGACALVAATGLVLAGCGPRGDAAPAPQGAAPPAATADAAPKPATASTATAATATAAAAPVIARETEPPAREAVNPDSSTMVFLYFQLAGVKPPLDEWIENDNRVRFAAPIDKAGKRALVRGELESGIAAARGIARLRISLNDAQLSEYDPAYGEFTVRALGPASELSFETLGQKVRTRFANGETAQLWRVSADQAQAVRDRVARRTVQLDVVLKVTGVQPGPGGGAITTEIEEYTLRAGDGSTLARVQVGRG